MHKAAGVAKVLQRCIVPLRMAWAPGEKVTMRKVDIPSSTREPVGEGAITDPTAEEPLNVVREVDENTTEVNFRGKPIVVDKKLLRSGG